MMYYQTSYYVNPFNKLKKNCISLGCLALWNRISKSWLIHIFLNQQYFFQYNINLNYDPCICVILLHIFSKTNTFIFEWKTSIEKMTEWLWINVFLFLWNPYIITLNFNSLIFHSLEKSIFRFCQTNQQICIISSIQVSLDFDWKVAQSVCFPPGKYFVTLCDPSVIITDFHWMSCL